MNSKLTFKNSKLTWDGVAVGLIEGSKLGLSLGSADGDSVGLGVVGDVVGG